MTQIIASVFARSREQVARDGRRAAMAGADWLELRLDEWPAHEDLAATIASVGLPVLVTVRTPNDGGSFRGTLLARRELLQHALQVGARGIDLEQWESWTPPAGLTGLKLRIRSFHSFTGVPKELTRIRDELAVPGTVAKIVVTAHDLADAAPVFELLRTTDQREQPTAAFAMGRTAWPVRVLSAALGAPFVYGRLDGDEGTVPDQPTVAQLAGLFRVRDLGPDTGLFGVLGNPALSSLGPWLHNRAFRRLGVDAIYLPFETSRPADVLAMLPRARLAGLSVTAPFKQQMSSICDSVSAAAADAGAVNTIVRAADGGWVGHNTDVTGVRAALAAAGAGADRDEPAVVLGAGGAARAGALALRSLGYQVTMLARSHEPVREFAARHGFRIGSLSEAVLVDLAPRVVVHATPVGSLARDPDERLVPGWQPAAGTIVHDMVYRPHRTRLLRDAAAAGAIAVPGLEMFLHQAREQLRLFTGKDLQTPALRAFLAGSVY